MEELGSQAKSWGIMYGMLGLGVNHYLYGAFKHGNCIIKLLFWKYPSGCLCRKWIGESEPGGKDSLEAANTAQDRDDNA